jgi:dipeptidyl aminopeptidase/acylaminoacyl peptidase
MPLPAPPVDDFLAVQSSTAPAFAKDGRTLFHLSDATGLAQIWALDLKTLACRQLTNEDEKVAFFNRSPLDDTLVYGVDRGGDERQQLKLLRRDGCSAALTEAPDVIHSFGAWAPDGAAIAFASNAREASELDAFALDIATGATRLLHRGDGLWSVASWSPKGTKLLLVNEHSTSNTELHLLDLAMGSVRSLKPRTGAGRYQSFRWKPDGSGFYCCTDVGRDFLGVAAIDATSLEHTWLYTAEHVVETIALSPDGKLLAMLGNVEGYSTLRVRDLATGTDRDVAIPARSCIGELAWSPDNKNLALSLANARARYDLFLWQADAASLVPLTPPAVGGIAADDPAEAELVCYPTFDGRQIPAFLYLPAGAPPAGGRKAAIWVHGGPEVQSRPVYRADIQLLVSRGYAVLVPNVRGSSGYGRFYASLDDVERRMDSVEDLRHGALWLGQRPDIDARRIAVIGQSYGGFMVLAALTEHPQLWKAGVEHYGIADFRTMLAETGRWRRRHRAAEYGDPVRDAELLARISPLGKMEHLAAPLLVTHGRRDPRVPFAESERLVARLRELGKPVEYLTFDYAGHGYVQPQDRLVVHRAIIDFLERYV